MKRQILKKYNKLISILLSILGIGGTYTFSGCDKTPGAEYGTPHATFKVYGTVTSENGIKIPNIKVAMHYDSSYTDENGNYNIEIGSFPNDQEFFAEFTDIDGVVNGSYQSKDTIISFENPQFENGDGSWYSGKTSQEVDIKLEEDN